MRKKGISITILAALSLSMLCTGCGSDTAKSSTAATTSAASTTSTEATTAAETTTAAPETTAAPAETEAPVADTSGSEPSGEPTEDTPPKETYAGLTEIDAITKALEFAGPAYAQVSAEQAYLRNVEHWLIGVHRDGDTESLVYYIYVSADEVVPQEELPQ